MIRRIRPLLLAFATVAAVLACDGSASDDAEGRSPVAGGVVDSTLPIDTLLHRFRATLPDTPTVLAGGAASPEALTRELLSSLQSNDTSTLRALVISPAEFAWLYYPHTKWTKPPYEMGAELVWLQVSLSSEKGLVRLVRRYGGRALRLEALTCPDAAHVEGPNLVTEGCQVRFAVADSVPRELRLFGSLLKRDGLYKFVSYSNDL
jgi:hypothetical protein